MNPTFHFRLMAAAACMFVMAPVCAQSSVTIGGSLDIGIFKDTAGAKNVGTIQRSTLNFAGVEDLGDGLAATFRLSHRLDLDTGTPEGNGAKPFWHGESTVGLKGGFGAIRMGRALDAIQSQDWAFDPWENYDRIASPAWDLWHWNYSADPAGGGSGRVANAIFYNSPKAADTSFQFSGSPESPAGAVTKTRAASLLYNNGTVRALLGTAKNSAGATETSVGLRGNVGDYAMMGLYNESESASGSKAKVITLGGIYRVGSAALKAGWGQADVDGVKKEKITSAGASYALSKRTAVYADLASKRFAATGTKHVYGVGLTVGF